jgi:hypothetical protein
MAPRNIYSMSRPTAVARQNPFKGYAPMQTRDLLVYIAVLSWLLQRSGKAARSFEIHKSTESIYHLTSSQKESRQDSSQRWCLCRASTRPFTTARRSRAVITSSWLEAASLLRSFLSCARAGTLCDRCFLDPALSHQSMEILKCNTESMHLYLGHCPTAVHTTHI